MNEKPKTITRLVDYTPPTYLVERVWLQFQLHDEACLVQSRLEMRRNPASKSHNNPPLSLDGRELELIEIRLNGLPLNPDQFQLTEEQLLIPNAPETLTLETTTRIHPKNNLSLEGLYRSGSLFCTQCEAEGFRKITFFPDRPDVMARFTVTLEADRETVPILLANGNLIQTGEKPNNRHFAIWGDPFPKPAYLFALVAGNLVCQQDHFVTCTGRTVTLQVWVEPQNSEKCQHALESLKKAISWDETRFGREYDLDLYMIVAVNDFNMGAMENKGLNLFNAQYVLADQETTTDANYEEIESIIAHEYFHNWTGNRITCRDWFQLSLKEGLTIFRDQEFSTEVGSRSVQRIRDVLYLRTHQFPEDAGPTAHPVRPDSYMEINNFYTMTIYNKGAEVVRMIQALIGRAAFRQGMDLYFLRHDGQAVTVEEFILAMETASQRDLSQFRQWYQQVGTPELIIQWTHAQQTQCFTLTIEQRNRESSPLHIPFALALLHPVTGAPLPLALTGEDPALAPTERLLELTQPSETFCFINIPHAPIPSLLRGFTAPVKRHAPFTNTDLAFLWGMDNDPFNRWDAGQELATRVLLQTAADPLTPLSPLFLQAFATTLGDRNLEPALIALALTLPDLHLLMEKQEPTTDPDALHQARETVRRQLALGCQDGLLRIYNALQTSGPCQRDATAIGRRSLKNLALSYLMVLPENDLPTGLAMAQLAKSDNMTDCLGALIPLIHAGRIEAESILSQMEQKWHDNPLAMNKWFAIQATAPLDDALDRVKKLMHHPKFELRNPNKVRALIGSFCTQNLSRFHDQSGSGYRFLVEQVLTLDPMNPQVAARLTGTLSRWRRFEPVRQNGMKNALQEIVQIPNLSRNTYEIASKSLNGLHD